LLNLKELQELLRNSRARDNVLPAGRDDYRNILDSNRKVESVESIKTNKSHKMVEEAMLCANKCASDFVSSNYGDAIYKTQGGILDNKVTSVYLFLRDYISLDKSMLSSFDGFKNVMTQVEKHESCDYLKSIINLYLKDSEFSDKSGNHISMGFDSYTYFTSPIRRYSDIIIHRIIKSKIRKKKYKIQKDDYINHFKNKSKAIYKCSMETEKWMQASYLNRFLPSDVLKGRIVGVTSSTLSVKLVDSGIVGVLILSKILSKGDKALLSKLSVSVGDKDYHVLDDIEVSIDKVISEDNSVVFNLV